MKRHISARSVAIRALVATFWLAAAGVPCRAAPLFPVVFGPGSPNLQGANETLSYNAATNVFDASVSGVTALNSLTYLPAMAAPADFLTFDTPPNPSLDFNVRVDRNGNFLGNGTGVTLTGALDFDQDGTDDVTGTLLTGTITAFGTAPAGPALGHFSGFFTVTGGLLSAPFALSGGGTHAAEFRLGRLGGFDLTAEQTNSGILGDFSASFSATKVKSDTGIIPEPSSLALSLIGVVALAAFDRVRRRPR